MACPRLGRRVLFAACFPLNVACALAAPVDEIDGGGGDAGDGAIGGIGFGGTGGTGAAGTGGTGTAGTGTGGTGTGGNGTGATAGTGAGGSGGTGSGGTGTGGTGAGGTGAGGTGTGGAAGGDGGGRCSTKTKAAGADGMIDDFADGDLNVLIKDSRMGAWVASAGTLAAEGGALHYTGPQTGWASFTVAVAACYDATAYQGIKFKIWGKAPGPNGVSFVTPTPPTVAPPVGTCAGTLGCDHFRYKMAMISAAATEVSFTWSQLKQNGWGDPAPGYNVAANLIEIGFGGEDEAFAYDFYVDDVQFY